VAPTQTCISGETLRLNGTQAACQVAGGNWSFPKCSVAGVCNLGPSYLDKASCDLAGGQFRFATDIIRCVDVEEYGRENGIPAYEAAHYTGNHTQRGQMITGLCMNCHRQETGTTVRQRESGNIKVGYDPRFDRRREPPGGHQFLNSRGKYRSFAQIPTSKFKYNMTASTGWFMTEAEAASTGNGCTGCHDVHLDRDRRTAVQECTMPAET
jgi:hypothetical protein